MNNKLDRIGVDEFKRMYFDRTLTTKMLVSRLGIDKKTMGRWADALNLPQPRSKAVKPLYSKHEAVCQKCNHLQWCKDNPYANKLPCEVQGTPRNTYWKEINVYPSMSGFWLETDNRRSN